jgi:hypothetical protein
MSTERLLVPLQQQHCPNTLAAQAEESETESIFQYRSLDLCMAPVLCALAFLSSSDLVLLLDLCCVLVLALALVLGLRLSALVLCTALLQATTTLSRTSEFAAATHQTLALALVGFAPIWCCMNVSDTLWLSTVALASSSASSLLIDPPALSQVLLLLPVSFAALLHAHEMRPAKRSQYPFVVPAQKLLLHQSAKEAIDSLLNDAGKLLDDIRAFCTSLTSL